MISIKELLYRDGTNGVVASKCYRTAKDVLSRCPVSTVILAYVSCLQSMKQYLLTRVTSDYEVVSILNTDNLSMLMCIAQLDELRGKSREIQRLVNLYTSIMNSKTPVMRVARESAEEAVHVAEYIGNTVVRKIYEGEEHTAKEDRVLVVVDRSR